MAIVAIESGFAMSPTCSEMVSFIIFVKVDDDFFIVFLICCTCGSGE